MPRYEYTEGTANKFWEVDRARTTLTVRWGRIGATGRNEKIYTLGSDAEAAKKYDKLVAEKTAKGYQLVGGKPAKATPTKRAGWLAKLEPTKAVKGKAGRIFDVRDEAPVVVDPAKVEKHVGLPVGPVMRDLIELCQLMFPSAPGDAIGPLADYQALTFECFYTSHKNIGHGHQPKSLRPFASDHKNVVYFYLAGTTTDDCPIAYESVVDADEPKIVAKDLVTWLSQLAYRTPPGHLDTSEKKEHERIARSLRCLPGVTKKRADETLPEEVDELELSAKPAKAWAAAFAEASDAAVAASKPLAIGGANVSPQDLAKAEKLHEKGGVLGSGTDAKKLGLLKEALAIVGGATEGEAAALRLEIEKDLLGNYIGIGKLKEGKQLAERLLVDYADRGITDADAWQALADIVEQAKLTVPVKHRAAVREAWSTAQLTDFVGDQKTKPKPPKDGKGAYNQARVELFHKQFARAHKCLAIGKTDEDWGPNAETLEVEVLRQEGKADEARRLWQEIVEREVDGPRYSHIQWSYLAALYVALDVKQPALAKRIVKVWNTNAGQSSPSLFALA